MSGLPLPESNFFRVPNVFWEIDLPMTQRIVMLYIIRHTWGFHEYGITKRITIDEFQHGRKLSNGERMDKGTGLSKGAISETLRKLEDAGLLEVETDNSDKARVKKSYALVIQRSPNEHSFHDANTAFTDRTRSEKETKEKKQKKETKEKESATPNEIPFSDVPTQQQMYGHIAGLFNYTQVPKSTKASIGKVAKELLEVGYDFDDVTGIYNYVKAMNFNSFTPPALLKYAPAWNASQPKTLVPPPVEDRYPEDHELASPEQIAEYEKLFNEVLLEKSGGKKRESSNAT